MKSYRMISSYLFEETLVPIHFAFKKSLLFHNRKTRVFGSEAFLNFFLPPICNAFLRRRV